MGDKPFGTLESGFKLPDNREEISKLFTRIGEHSHAKSVSSVELAFRNGSEKLFIEVDSPPSAADQGEYPED